MFPGFDNIDQNGKIINVSNNSGRSDDNVNASIGNEFKDYTFSSRELPPFFLPNTGNMGIPICLFAYGSLGMGVAAAISSLVVLLHFTANIFLASKKFDVLVIAKMESGPFR